MATLRITQMTESTGQYRVEIALEGDGRSRQTATASFSFSMADQEIVTKQLEIAGYETISFDRVDAPLMVGDTIDDAINFQIALGPAGEVYREAGDLAIEKHTEIEAALEAALKQHVTPEGVILDSSSWVIRARNPA